MNDFYKFQISKDGNVFYVSSPEGTPDYDVAVSCLNPYQPCDIIRWEKICTNERRGGWFG